MEKSVFQYIPCLSGTCFMVGPDGRPFHPLAIEGRDRAWVSVRQYQVLNPNSCRGRLPPSRARLFRGLGTIRAVNAGSGKVLIEHEDIPGLMPAMTMMFAVSDQAMLDGLSPEQGVEFEVENKQGTYEIQSISPREK